jgi:hypothetical protein
MQINIIPFHIRRYIFDKDISCLWLNYKGLCIACQGNIDRKIWLCYLSSGVNCVHYKLKYCVFAKFDVLRITGRYM